MTLCEATTRRPTTTTELLHAATAGDDGAWHELVHRFEPAVMGVIGTYRMQEADARDAAQRTWLQMIEHHHRLREPEALAGWLRTTAKRECLRILRDQRSVEPRDLASAECTDTTVDIEQDVVDADLAGRVRRLVNKLPARSIELLSSLFQDDPPGYAQIARLTGIPIGSIGPTRARALRRLRRLIEDDLGLSTAGPGEATCAAALRWPAPGCARRSS